MTHEDLAKTISTLNVYAAQANEARGNAAGQANGGVLVTAAWLAGLGKALGDSAGQLTGLCSQEPVVLAGAVRSEPVMSDEQWLIANLAKSQFMEREGFILEQMQDIPGGLQLIRVTDDSRPVRECRNCVSFGRGSSELRCGEDGSDREPDEVCPTHRYKSLKETAKEL